MVISDNFEIWPDRIINYVSMIAEKKELMFDYMSSSSLILF